VRISVFIITAARRVFRRPRIKAMSYVSPLQFPCTLHHHDEVLIVVNGRTDAAEVVDELLLGYLRQKHTWALITEFIDAARRTHYRRMCVH